MGKMSLLVACPQQHYALRELDALHDVADICVSDDPLVLREFAARTEVILWTGLCSPAVTLGGLWPQVPVVRWVHSLTAGVEHILFPALVNSDVAVTNSRGVFKRSLAEFAVLGILYHFKKVPRLIDNQRHHRWDDFLVKSAERRVLAVVGYGEIGRECAVLCKGLGMQIHAIRRNPGKSSADPVVDRLFTMDRLHDMLAGADVVLCAAPLTPDTHHMIGAAQFDCMQRHAIFINVGRGPVVEEAALVRALEQRVIAGASLDVFESEPLRPESPLWDMPNVLISPHCTDRTEDPDWLQLTMRFFVTNVERYRSGKPLDNVVDKKAGY